MDEELDYTWNCPNCGVENLDNYGETVRPLCSDCDKDFGWDDIATREVITKLNNIMALDGLLYLANESN